jgi:hypothetical protein
MRIKTEDIFAGSLRRDASPLGDTHFFVNQLDPWTSSAYRGPSSARVTFTCIVSTQDSVGTTLPKSQFHEAFSRRISSYASRTGTLLDPTKSSSSGAQNNTLDFHVYGRVLGDRAWLKLDIEVIGGVRKGFRGDTHGAQTKTSAVRFSTSGRSRESLKC